MNRSKSRPQPFAAPATEPLLSVQELRVSMTTGEGPLRAVDDLSFTLHRNRTLGIVGESGSGKSTTALALLGLHDRKRVTVSGRITIDGQQIVGASGKRLRQIRGGQVGLIFQDPLAALHPFYTVGRQITETYRAHRQASERTARVRAIEMLERVGMPQPTERLNSYPHELSGGMRQRAMIAIALVCDPDLLVADEPTTALDVTVQAQILDLLKELQRDRGSAIIYISHNLAVIHEVADDVLVMYAGRCVEYGGSEQVMRRPRHPYTAALLSSHPALTGDVDVPLEAIPGNSPSLVERVAGCPYRPRCAFTQQVGRRCSQELPQLRPAQGDADHRVACHYSGPLR
jgi:peptide/nickel transport system ATP-binding protein